MKRKLFTSVLIAALLIVALAATALAIGLRRSAEADAVARAREALIADYNLSQETIGCFSIEAEQEGGTWTVTFTGSAWELEQLGTYTVQLGPEDPPRTSWSHDAIDPLLWQDGNMDAPAWGQKQIMQKLRKDAELRKTWAQTDWDNLSFAEEAKLSPVFWGTLGETGRTVRFERIVPGADDIPKEQAARLAKEAIVSAYGIEGGKLAGYEEHISFAQPQGGGQRQYVVEYAAPAEIKRPISARESYTVYIASPSGETLFLQWNVSNERRTLPDGALDGYAHAVEEFMNAGALEVKMASEKADIAARARKAGLDELINPMLPYAMPGDQDLPEADAIVRANDVLMSEYEMEDEALALFDVPTSLLEMSANRYWEITYTPKALQTPDDMFWQTAICEKIGAYAIQLDASTGDFRKAVWSRAEDWMDGAYTQSTWAAAPAYHGKLLQWVKELRGAVSAVWAKYPDDAMPHELSREDAAAYDTLFREAGFDGFPRGMPGEDSIPYEEAWAVAKEAILAEMPHAEKALDAGYISGNYSVYDPEAPVWGFSAYFVVNGIEILYGVSVDAKTGEVLLLEAATGGNG